jgi:hypothetical protein
MSATFMPDILGGDVAAAQAGDGAAEGGEHFGRLGPRLVGEDDGLAPPPKGRPAMAFL